MRPHGVRFINMPKLRVVVCDFLMYPSSRPWWLPVPQIFGHWCRLAYTQGPGSDLSRLTAKDLNSKAGTLFFERDKGGKSRQ